jgi:hypothetical protein
MKEHWAPNVIPFSVYPYLIVTLLAACSSGGVSREVVIALIYPTIRLVALL